MARVFPYQVETEKNRRKDKMPVYEYEHIGDPCKLGKVFDCQQSIEDNQLKTCPECGGEVRKLVSRVNISTPKTNAELKDLGFTKLVKRDDGVYENVTARDGESRYMKRDKPETMPDLSKNISD
jgi:putative FmdB family regulatory protein